MHFSDEQRDLFDRDVDKIYEVWQQFINEQVNGSEVAHFPPALLKACAQIFMGLMQRLHEIEGGFAVALDEQTLGSLLANMFEFGQYALKHGVSTKDLTPCQCGAKLTDADIEKLLNAHLN